MLEENGKFCLNAHLLKWGFPQEPILICLFAASETAKMRENNVMTNVFISIRKTQTFHGLGIYQTTVSSMSLNMPVMVPVLYGTIFHQCLEIISQAASRERYRCIFWIEAFLLSSEDSLVTHRRTIAEDDID